LFLGLDAYLGSTARPRAAWFASGWLVLLMLVQPLSIVAAAVAIGFHQILEFARTVTKHPRPDILRSLRPAAIALAAPAIMLGGYALLLRRDIFLQAWAAQNILKSPHPAHYLLAYGLLLPFAFLGVRRAWRQEHGEGRMLLGWAVLLPVLAYAPTVIQRRLPEGGWVVLATLAAIGLGGARLRDAVRWRLAAGVLALSMVSPAFLLFGAFRGAAAGQIPAFQPANQVAAFEWLAENAESEAVVLTSFQTGNALPAWAPTFVVIGHGPESAGLHALAPRVNSYFAESGAGTQAAELLQEFHVDYVFVGEAERALGFDAPLPPPGLTEAYSEGGIAIYRVDSDPSAGWRVPIPEAVVMAAANRIFTIGEEPAGW